MDINQNTIYTETNLNVNLNSMLKSFVQLNKKFIDEDIRSLKAYSRTCNSIKTIKKIKEQLEYLVALRQSASNKINTYSFSVQNGKIRGVGLRNEEYKVTNVSDYTALHDYVNVADNTSYIMLDYTDLMNGLALEVSYEDYLFSIDEIEEELDQYNTVSTYSGKILTEKEWIPEGGFREIKDYKVGESSYKVSENNAIDYFYYPVKFEKTYKNIIESTNGRLKSILLDDVITASRDLKIRISLIDVTETGFVLNVSNKNENYAQLIAHFRKPIRARILGRKLCFNTKMTVIEV